MNQLMERRGLWFGLSALMMLPAIVYMLWSLWTPTVYRDVDRRHYGWHL